MKLFITFIKMVSLWVLLSHMWTTLPLQEQINLSRKSWRELTVSKIEKDKFRYTGIDVSVVKDGIKVQTGDYMDSLKKIKEIQKADRDDDLTKAEITEYKKMTGKLSWLANSTRPDLVLMHLLCQRRIILPK